MNQENPTPDSRWQRKKKKQPSRIMLPASMHATAP